MSPPPTSEPAGRRPVSYDEFRTELLPRLATACGAEPVALEAHIVRATAGLGPLSAARMSIIAALRGDGHVDATPLSPDGYRPKITTTADALRVSSFDSPPPPQSPVVQRHNEMRERAPSPDDAYPPSASAEKTSAAAEFLEAVKKDGGDTAGNEKAASATSDGSSSRPRLPAPEGAMHRDAGGIYNV